MGQGHPRSLTVSVIELSEITSKLEHVGKCISDYLEISEKRKKHAVCYFKAPAPSGRRLARLSVLSRVKNCRQYFSKGTRVQHALMGLKGYRNI